MATTDDLLTLQEAADELKVHYMTAYRWVRRGDLEAFKAGGRLRVTREALEAYKQTRVVDTAMPPSRRITRRDWGRHTDALLEVLLQGDEPGALYLVNRVISDGATAGEVYLKLIAPSLVRIGELWESGTTNVAVEHRATHIASGIMTRLSDHFRRRGPKRGTAVTLTPPGETHGVGAAMVADFLRGAGWEVHHLGVDVPLADLALFLEIVPADVVCVSIASRVKPAVYEELVAACGDRHVILGGKGADLTLAEPLGVAVIESPDDMIAHLEVLYGQESTG